MPKAWVQIVVLGVIVLFLLWFCLLLTAASLVPLYLCQGPSDTSVSLASLLSGFTLACCGNDLPLSTRLSSAYYECQQKVLKLSVLHVMTCHAVKHTR